MLAQAMVHGLLQGGMSSCGKHFPGHGFVKADSHVAIPVDRRSLKAILADDARPFEWMSGTLAAVMPAHVIYPKVDMRPAGFSQKWLKNILRGKFGFDGAIFSDDLSMEAGRYIDGRLLSYTDAALAALEAGCDMALLCNQSVGEGAPLDELLDGFSASVKNGRWTPEESSEARRRNLLPTTPPLPWDTMLAAPRYQRAIAALSAI